MDNDGVPMLGIGMVIAGAVIFDDGSGMGIVGGIILDVPPLGVSSDSWISNDGTDGSGIEIPEEPPAPAVSYSGTSGSGIEIPPFFFCFFFWAFVRVFALGTLGSGMDIAGAVILELPSTCVVVELACGTTWGIVGSGIDTAGTVIVILETDAAAGELPLTPNWGTEGSGMETFPALRGVAEPN